MRNYGAINLDTKKYVAIDLEARNYGEVNLDSTSY